MKPWLSSLDVRGRMQQIKKQPNKTNKQTKNPNKQTEELNTI